MAVPTASHRPTARRLVPILAAAALTAGTLLATAAPVAALPSGASTAADTSWLPTTPEGWTQVVDHTVGATDTITRGVTRHAETYDAVKGREQIQVLDVDTGDANVHLATVMNHDRVQDPHNETTSSMAQRTGAVAGVNGGYFAINASGEPLGGTVTDGRIVKSPASHFEAQLSVLSDGRVVMGQQTYTGTVHDGAESHAITSVNTVGDVSTGGISHVTHDLGATQTIPAATLVTGTIDGARLHVTSVSTGVTQVPLLPTGEAGLLGGGDGGSWLSSTVKTGDTLSIDEGISPDAAGPHGTLRQLISGVDTLVKDGKSYDDPTGTPPVDGGVHPETAIGVSQDGRHVIMVTVDGGKGAGGGLGVTATEATGLMLQLGAYDALLFDGGGSTTMVARNPGQTKVSVTNDPSDDKGERPVANGLFVYSTAKRAGTAASVTLHHDQPLTVLAGSRVRVPAYARDRLSNPAAEPVSYAVRPSSLASIDGTGTLRATSPGDGLLVATAGRARKIVPLHVVSALTSLTMSPTQVDLDNGAKQTFTLAATAAPVSGGRAAAAEVPGTAARWSVAPSSLGTVSAAGTFTAAATGVGLATVSATAGGRTASASVAVGSESKVINAFDDSSQWSLRNTTGRDASLTTVAGAVPPGSTEKAGTQLTYSMPGNAGVKQLVLSAKGDDPVAPISPDGRAPSAIGLWVHGDGSGIYSAVQLIGADGTPRTIYPAYITWKDWQRLIVPVPTDLKAPISVGFVDFLGVNPDHDLAGTLQLSDLQALYSPRPVTETPYVAIPQNPSWLRYTENPAEFTTGGATTLMGDDAHLLAATPDSASHHMLATVAANLPSLPAQARPQSVQMLGDMPDDGALTDLQEAKKVIASLRLPYRDIVGNHEITQGADPENKNFTQVFGDTHYAYSLGSSADVVVTDNAHGSLLKSDPFQVPAEPQYPWLVQQLSAATSTTVLVVTHMPAYDPNPAANSQFTDRWEAREYVRLVQRYQQSHPAKHVVMFYGHARGFFDQMIDPDGVPTDAAHGGIPQLTFADLGMPPYAPTDRGGFYHYGLVHTAADGTVQFAVQPVLSGIDVAAPGIVKVGRHVNLKATGTMVGGTDQPTRTLPIADPASHVWRSSNPSVATVDPRTGLLVARRAGTTTVTVESGQTTGTISVTVH